MLVGGDQILPQDVKDSAVIAAKHSLDEIRLIRGNKRSVLREMAAASQAELEAIRGKLADEQLEVRPRGHTPQGAS